MSLLMIRVIFEILLDCIECFFAFFLELFSSLRYDIFLFHFFMIWSCVCTIILHILHEGAATLLVICNLFTVNFVAFEQESRIIAYLRNKASSTKPFPKALKHDWKPSTQGWWGVESLKKLIYLDVHNIVFVKKSRPKKLVKSNKSISRNLFWPNSIFLPFQKWPKINFWTGTMFKTAKNAISQKKKKLIYLISWVFCLDLAHCVGHCDTLQK